MFLKIFLGHNIDLRLLHHQGLLCQGQACLLSDKTPARLNRVTTFALTNKFAKTLLPPDTLDVYVVYQDFCNIIRKTAKKTIPRDHPDNHISCWDAECGSLYTALLAKLDRERRDRWSEAVWGIDVSHGVYLTTLLIGHDTLRVTVPFLLMLLRLSWSEMGDTSLLTARHLDLFLKKCRHFITPLEGL